MNHCFPFCPCSLDHCIVCSCDTLLPIASLMQGGPHTPLAPVCTVNCVFGSYCKTLCISQRRNLVKYVYIRPHFTRKDSRALFLYISLKVMRVLFKVVKYMHVYYWILMWTHYGSKKGCGYKCRRERERLSSITLSHKLKWKNSACSEVDVCVHTLCKWTCIVGMIGKSSLITR